MRQATRAFAQKPTASPKDLNDLLAFLFSLKGT